MKSLTQWLSRLRLALTRKRVMSQNCNIAYGILRSCDAIFRSSQHWFNVDRGYYGAGHFSGYYRISYRGTQFRWHDKLPQSEQCVALKPFRRGTYTLICPPTPDVCKFFGVDHAAWLGDAMRKAGPNRIIRYKTDKPLDFTDVDKVITFNSSVGWLALQEGIMVDSDPLHSAVGSHYATKSIDTYESFMHIDREPLFRAMLANQFTLAEIEQGKACKFISDMIAEKPFAAMSLPIPSSAELNP